MKKTFLLMVLTIFPLILLCQNNNEMVLDSVYEYSWDPETNDWINSSRYVYVYDAKGNKTEEIRYRNSNAGEWIWTDRWIASYDSNGNQTEYIEIGWDPKINGWYNSHRHVYVYDANGNQTEQIEYWWDRVSGEWYEAERFCHLSCRGGRYVYNYDSIGNLVERIYFDWDTLTNEWIEPESNFFTYDSCGNLIRETGYGAGWMFTVPIRNDYKYDSIGNQTEHIHYSWDFDANDFIKRKRYVYSYDVSGNKTLETNYHWDHETNDWKLDRSDSTNYIYYEYGNKAEEIYYSLDLENNKWVYERKFMYSWSIPLLMPQTFYLVENCIDTTIFSSMVTGINYPRKNITFKIIGGNAYHMIVLDTISGDFILNAGDLDYETNSSYTLNIEAQYKDSTGIITDEALIGIYLKNINDNAPLVRDRTFSITENNDKYEVVGKVIASDADGNLNPLFFSIKAEEDSTIFGITDTRGNIFIKYRNALDYEIQKEYSITVSVSDGTFTTEATIIINVLNEVETSAEDLKTSKHFKIYPNPANDILYLEFPAQFQDGFDVEIISVTGKLICQKFGYIEQIDLSNFPPGVYLISVKSKNFVSTKKIIKQ